MSDSTRPSVDSTVTLALTEEHLTVSREQVETGAVRVRIAAQQTTHTVALAQWFDDTEVQRVAIDRPVDAAREPWHDGDVLVVPVYEERVVVQRQLVLKEEVRILLRRHHQVVEDEVVLRSEMARLERRQPDGSWTAEPLPPVSDSR